MSDNRKVHFRGEDCSLEWRTYGNGRVALQLLCEDGSLMATATCNLPELGLQEGEAFIKDYSENEGMLDALVKAGIVKETGFYAENDFGVRFPVVRVLPEVS